MLTVTRRLLVCLAFLIPIGVEAFAADPARGPRALLRSGVRLLDEGSLRGLAAGGESAVLEFERIPPSLRGVRRGHVLVAGVDERAPGGLLRRVTHVRKRAGRLIVETEPATLEDVFWFGRAQARVSLAPETGRLVAHVEGVRAADASAQAWSPGRLELELADVVLYDLDGDPGSIGDQVRVRGSVGLEPTFDVDLDVAWGRIRRFAFTNSTRLDTTLELDGRVTVNLDSQLTIATVQLPPVTFMVGPIPVVLVPVLELNVGVSGSVSAGLRTSVSAGVSIAAGVSFENGVWSGSSTLPDGPEDLDLVWRAPELWAEAQAEARVGPRLTVLLYGVAGPYASAFGYSAVEASLPARSWSLDFGLRGEVGVAVAAPPPGVQARYPVASFERRWPIAAGTFEAEAVGVAR